MAGWVFLVKKKFRCAAVLFYTRRFLGGGREKFRTYCLRWYRSSFMVIVLFVFGLAYIDFSLFKCAWLGRNNFLFGLESRIKCNFGAIFNSSQ